jgi:hypothetical protein
MLVIKTILSFNSTTILHKTIDTEQLLYKVQGAKNKLQTLFYSAQACCMAGPSSNLGSAPQPPAAVKMGLSGFYEGNIDK